MSETTYTPDVESFLARVLRATKRGIIAWEATANPELIVAPLEGEYSIRLEMVPDFEGATPEPDHILSLYKARKIILRIDRREISLERLNKVSGEEYDTAYQAFNELWKYASLKANRIPEEIEAVNRLLDKKLLEE
ncbi:MAG: hypothetical protein M3362_14095 [Acidobacteriota bacterium]|nr:hypothetical protein [Acidobacteriota bacterium]